MKSNNVGHHFCPDDFYPIFRDFDKSKLLGVRLHPRLLLDHIVVRLTRRSATISVTPQPAGTLEIVRFIYCLRLVRTVS